MNDNIASKRLGEKMRALRKKHNMSLRQLARELEVAPSFVARLESGDKNPNLAMLLKLIRVFDISADVLIRDELDLGK